MGSTEVRRLLLGDTARYEGIIGKHAAALSVRYGDAGLSRQLASMRSRFVSLGPMALCDSVLSDLGTAAPDDLLAGIGLMAFHISTHDDIVDETPDSRAGISALLYSGNIALAEGVGLLIGRGYLGRQRPRWR